MVYLKMDYIIMEFSTMLVEDTTWEIIWLSNNLFSLRNRRNYNVVFSTSLTQANEMKSLFMCNWAV